MFGSLNFARRIIFLVLVISAVAVAAGLGCSKRQNGLNFLNDSSSTNNDSVKMRIGSDTAEVVSGQLQTPFESLLDIPDDIILNTISKDGFTLIPFDDTQHYRPELNSFYRLSVTTEGDRKIVDVNVENAVALKYALIELRYDPSCVRPVSVEINDFLGNEDKTIRLSTTTSSGRIPVGIAMLNYDTQDGITGSGCIAKLTFESGSFDGLKSVCKVASEPENRVSLTNADLQNFRGSFVEKNVGDYDNNGEVGVADITPIAIYYLDDSSSSTGAFNADGDSNGFVEVPDITPIATHYLNQVVGYEVYRIESTSAPNITDFSSSTLWQTLNRPSGLTGDNPKPTYNFTDPNTGANIWYAVAAIDSQQNKGLTSNILQGITPATGPVVNIESPDDESEVSGIVLIRVSATGSSPIAKVEIYIDNMVTPVSTITDTPYEYDWDTTGFTTEDDHTIRAVATDIASETGQDEISVHNILFNVTLTPADGTEVSGTVTIQANVTGTGVVDNVAFYVDDMVTPVVTDDTAPYTYDWDTSTLTTESSHLVRAIATDTQDRTATAEVNLPNVFFKLFFDPPDESSFNGGVVTVTVTSDYIGTFNMAFSIDGLPVGTDDTAPYTYDWDVSAASVGQHTFEVDATDDQSRQRTVSVNYRKRDNTQVLPDEWETAKNLLGLGAKTMGPGNDIFGIPVDTPPAALNWGDPYVQINTVLDIHWNAWLCDPEGFPVKMRDLGNEIGSDNDLQATLLTAINEEPERFRINEQSHNETLDPTDPLAVAIADFITDAGGTPDLDAYKTALAPLSLEAQNEFAPVIYAASQALQMRNQSITDLGITLNDMVPYFNYGHGSVSGLAVLAIDPNHINDIINMWVPDNHWFDGWPYNDAFYTGAALISDAVDDLTVYLETNPTLANVNLDVETPVGRITIGGTGDDTHAIAPDGNGHAILFDLGGNDTYNCHAGGTASIYNGVAIAVDVSGNDIYNRIDDPDDFDRSQGYSDDDTSQQGAGRFGIGMLIDYAGDDQYYSVRMSQGGCVFGVGILSDNAGSDYYEAEALSQGGAFCGVAILIDKTGNDEYDAWVKSQGCGLIMGVGYLIDQDTGTDIYNAHPEQSAGKPEYYADVYEANISNCQGAGWGSRWGWLELNDGTNTIQVVVPGGFGMLFDGGGDDDYTCGVFGQGSGFFQSAGVLIDLEGNDVHDGWWYTNAGTAHVATAGLWDGGGDDTYLNERSIGIGGAHDWSVTWFMERDGNDEYDAANLDLGAGNANGFGYFIDINGDDTYTPHDGGGENATLGRGVFGSETRTNMVTYGIFIDVLGDDTYDAVYANMLAGTDDSTIITPVPDDWKTWIRADFITHGTNFYELEKGIGIDGQ